MMVDKIYYTDGHDVTVTDTTLTVKKKQYKLVGITKHGLSTIQPVRAHGWFFMLFGLSFVTIGAMRVLPPNMFPEVRIFGQVMGANGWAITAGAFCLLLGMLIVSFTRPRYAVHIATAEGEADVVVSRQREYIRQIIDALNRAYMALNMKGKGTARL